MDIFFFFLIFMNIVTSFHKKCWRHFKNDPAKQILVKYSVLRVTYTKLSIINQLSILYGAASNEPPSLNLSPRIKNA